jgi:hypothetical protein
MNDGSCRCFAVRRVNPFDGVLQVIEGDNARAYSPNGAVWQIQVRSARPDHTWRSVGDVVPIEQFFNFGLWDAEGGLHKIPANPVLDIGGMKAAADALVSILETVTERLPFTLIDNYELWSTDDLGQPVALLASTELPDTMRNTRVTGWRATRTPDHGFVADSLVRRGIDVRGDLEPRQHAEYLERKVQQLGRQRTWFRREPDGRGERIGETKSEAILESSAFPSLGLKTDWSDQQTAELARDYLAWSAPHLLLWQHITREERGWLEKEAGRQAVALAAVYRLLPEIVDADRIGAARVEARLRRPI